MRQSAQERLDQLRSKHEQEVTDTKLAERMNAGKKTAQEKRKGQEAVEREKNLRQRDHKLAGKDAKKAAAVLRKYQKADTTRLENAPVRTLRDAYHAPTITERIREKAEKLRTLHRNFYKAFINGTQAIDDFSKYQTVDANTSALLRTAVAAEQPFRRSGRIIWWVKTEVPWMIGLLRMWSSVGMDPVSTANIMTISSESFRIICCIATTSTA